MNEPENPSSPPPDPPAPVNTSQGDPVLAVDRAAGFKREIETLTPRAFFTPALIVINLAIFGLMLARGVHFMTPTIQSLIDWGANFGPKTTGGQWWRLFTSMFLHIGIIHVLMNMVVLWDIGRFVERLVGNAGFLALYVVSGLIGSLASIAWNPNLVSAGASGAVFGVYGALVGFILRERDTIPREVLTRVQRGAMAFIGYNLLFGLTAKGIDMAAHVGGLVGGLGCGLILSHPLTVAGVAGRTRRALIVLVSGAVLVAGAALALPKAVDVGGELERLGKTEDKVLGAYNGAVGKSHEGKLTDAEFAKVLEEQVLPPWRSMRAEMLKLKTSNKASKDLLEKLDRFTDARQSAWEMLADALRTNDAAKAKQSQEKWKQAEEIGKEISKLGEKVND